MLTPDMLHGYQKNAVNFQCSNPNTMIWMDLGLGKTATTLTSIAHLLNTGFLNGVIIVAPIRVIRLVWRQEAEKWQHTKGLKFSMVAGTRDQRTRALLRPANVYLINYENLGWLAETLDAYFVKKNRPLPFNGLVWDEISKMKNSTTQRVKSIRKILDNFVWTTGLTGTPASNGYKDLHGQFLVVDRGERLGTSKTAFRTRFYKKVGPYKEVAYADTEDTIKNLIGDITLEMSAEDYNKLPDLIVNTIEIELPEELRDKYDWMEKEFFIQLDSGKSVEMFNQASLTNKCLQFSNGAMYPVAGMPLWEPIHDLKLDALEEIIDEAQGEQILCSYAYRSDAERIMTRFKHLNPINLTECKSEGSLINAMRQWQSGDCPLMIGHPACLHPWTQVLTKRHGWVRIIDVERDDLVFDGVEFVKHDGCSYSGCKEVTDVFGITMTLDHKLLVGDEWVEARNVRDRGITSEQAQWFKDEGNGAREMSAVRKNLDADATERRQTQPRKTNPLFDLHFGHVSSDDEYEDVEYLARDEMASKRPIRQELRGSWNHRLQTVANLHQLLRGYVRRVFGRSDNRASGCEQTLRKEQLSMGVQYGATVQQTEQPLCLVPGGAITFGRTGEMQWVFKNDVNYATQSGDDGGRSGERLSNVGVREESESGERAATRKTHVYDLVDCGPRHQFLIRNDAGEMFISHNSMGHGIDGLQKRGNIVVWFGLTWSLDLYDQMTARIRRQGQGKPVICHRILTRDTLDQAQAMALDEKATTQAGLRSAVKQYRQSKGV
ncbi:MAG: SNF2-related protein [Patescibacteria group bacterium]